MQETSLLAYFCLQPTISDKQKMVFETIRSNERITNMEIANKLNWSINRVTPRVKELREQGLVILDGYRECHITGHTACLWKVC
jgi:Mn-dependent DtxR family transcriptional regulator